MTESVLGRMCNVCVRVCACCVQGRVCSWVCAGYCVAKVVLVLHKGCTKNVSGSVLDCVSGRVCIGSYDGFCVLEKVW